MDKKTLGLVLNWLANTASSDQLQLCKDIIDQKLTPEQKAQVQYRQMDFMGLSLSPLMQECIMNNRGINVQNYFVHIKGLDPIDVEAIIKQYQKTYAYRTSS